MTKNNSPLGEKAPLVTLQPSAKAAIPLFAWCLFLALFLTGVVLYAINQRPDIAQWFEKTFGTAVPGHILMWLLLGAWITLLSQPASLLLILKTTSYHVTNQRLEYTHGILNSRRHDLIELASIRDIRVRRTCMDRILGIATIIMETTDVTHPIIWLEAQHDAHALSDWLRELTAEERIHLNHHDLVTTKGITEMLENSNRKQKS